VIPLRIEATLSRSIVLGRPIHLDGLLGHAIVTIEDLPRASNASECVDLPIPLAEQDGVYLASAAEYAVEEHELAWVNKRFPTEMAQQLGDASFRSIQITAGINKSFREPLAVSHLEHDRIVWWAIGDQPKIERLLSAVAYLGGKRRFGYGEVKSWLVEPCETWEGFPVMRDGYPLRHLPADWPGLREDVERAYAVVRPPYWDRGAAVLAAVPC
jgi:CRISPR type IV-associated protein Csf3